MGSSENSWDPPIPLAHHHFSYEICNLVIMQNFQTRPYEYIHIYTWHVLGSAIIVLVDGRCHMDNSGNSHLVCNITSKIGLITQLGCLDMTSHEITEQLDDRIGMMDVLECQEETLTMTFCVA